MLRETALRLMACDALARTGLITQVKPIRFAVAVKPNEAEPDCPAVPVPLTANAAPTAPASAPDPTREPLAVSAAAILPESAPEPARAPEAAKAALTPPDRLPAPVTAPAVANATVEAPASAAPRWS